MNDVKKRFFGVFGIILFVGLALAVIFYGTPKTTSSIPIGLKGQAKESCLALEVYSESSKIEFEPILKTILDKNNVTEETICSKTDYCKMGTGRHGLPKSVFAMLPDYSEKTLSSTKALLRDPFRVTQLDKIDYSIYKQPEMYDRAGRTFSVEGKQMMMEIAAEDTGGQQHLAYGYGTYKSDFMVVMPEGTTDFNISFFVKADWGVKNFQGIKLNPVYPSSSTIINGNFKDGTKELIQNPVYVKCHVQFSEISPREFVLEPTYPSFYTGWVKLIKTKLKVSDLKKGKYVVGLDIAAPSTQFSEEMDWKFKPNYVPAGSIGTDHGWFNIYIEVV